MMIMVVDAFAEQPFKGNPAAGQLDLFPAASIFDNSAPLRQWPRGRERRALSRGINIF
jgi:hypothetical protein